jgi:hypothetical protein
MLLWYSQVEQSVVQLEVRSDAETSTPTVSVSHRLEVGFFAKH